MQRQALVLGLGQFGMALARALVHNMVEVIAVDRREDRVQIASSFVTEALQLDAMDEFELKRLAPERRDVCVVAIGDESREASILVTALLRQIGAPRVVARATDPLHERILSLVGAHEVVQPERIFGERLAARLSFRGVLDMLPLGDDLVITELATPPVFAGRTLADLQLPRRFNVTVVAVRRNEHGVGRLLLPEPGDPLRKDDILVLVGPPGVAQTLTERI